MRFAQACPGTAQVIRIGHDSEVGLDPLRLFADVSPKVAARFCESLPVVDTRRADAVVFAVNALQLPKKAELASERPGESDGVLRDPVRRRRAGRTDQGQPQGR
ncbi:hypothetical protein AB0D08_31440 [Kitasatospora sp. NPDC048540]|uniref:hypothetical protein n=1 Tax=Kitasatospora sp. NPDC048540 TaxID=3155634 RepID=UPI0033EBEEE4